MHRNTSYPLRNNRNDEDNVTTDQKSRDLVLELPVNCLIAFEKLHDTPISILILWNKVQLFHIYYL